RGRARHGPAPALALAGGRSYEYERRGKEHPMSVVDELLKNSEAYAATFDKGRLPMPPGKHIAVVACMDARLNPYGLLGLQEGDAHVIRNAGGVVTADEIRSRACAHAPLGI